MKSIETADLMPGMVAAKPIHSPQGALMFKEGTTFDEKTIWILKSWGVAEAWVEGDADDQSNRARETETGDDDNAKAPLEEECCGDLEAQVLAEIMRVAKKQRENRIYHK